MKTKQLLLGIAGLLLLAFNSNAQRESSSDLHLDEVYNLSAEGTVHLNSSDAEVSIKGTNRTDVHVKIDRVEDVRGFSTNRRRFDMNVEERSGDLYITEREGRGVRVMMGSYSVDYSIEIEMPTNGSLRIKGDDDYYVIRSIDGAISVSVDDGDVELIECNGEDFDLELEDGDLMMDGGKGTLYAKLDDGNIDIRNGSFSSVDIDVEDGDVSIETTLSDTGLYEFASDDGGIDLVVLAGGGMFNVLKDDGRVSAGTAFSTIRKTDSRAQFELTGGKTEVDIRVNDGRVRLSSEK